LSWYEVTGVIFGLLSVWLTVRQSVWCWPTGLVSVVAFAVLFLQIKLYADVGLQIFFFVTGVQGWYYWLYGGKHRTELPITQLTTKQILALALLLLVNVLLIGWSFSRYTDAHVPFWDAAASGASVVANLLLVRKKLESWYLWILVDVLSIGIYAYKQVWLTAGLFTIFLGLAIRGLIVWQRALKEATSQSFAAAA
jgi:nicotinamide mononucleotide transporter